MFTVSITPNNLNSGNNSCIAYYNYGGDSFPVKTLTINSTGNDIFFVENNQKKKQISWNIDSNHPKGFQHNIMIYANDIELSNGDVIKITLEEQDKLQHKIQTSCLVHFKVDI